MNHPLSIEQLKRLKVIMQTMLSEANNANWQELSRLDSERRVLINYKAGASNSHRFPGDQMSGIAGISKTGNDLPPPSLQPSQPARGTTSEQEYQALREDLVSIDREITNTVQKARQELLEQTRGLRAQVSAKKGYEQASSMKVSSYS